MKVSEAYLLNRSVLAERIGWSARKVSATLCAPVGLRFDRFCDAIKDIDPKGIPKLRRRPVYGSIENAIEAFYKERAELIDDGSNLKYLSPEEGLRIDSRNEEREAKVRQLKLDINCDDYLDNAIEKLADELKEFI